MRQIVAATLIGVSFVSGNAAAQAPGSSAPVGPFTAAQATRGKLVYERSCAACHGAALEGASAPSLAGRSFEARWRLPALTLDDLFYIARKTMPPRAAGTVSLEDHAAAVAYILEANGYVAGEGPLELGAPGLQAKFAWSGKYVTDAGATAVASADVLPADAGAAPGTVGPDQASLDAATRSTDWLVPEHDYAGTRYSPLDQVNVTNAAHLAPTCIFQVGRKDNFQTGPIVHRGTMYLTTATSTIALDAATCRVRWRHEWQLRGDVAWNRNRGVAIQDGRLVRGTPDGFLLALSTETGARLWARRVADPNAGETFTMAPVLYDGLVLIGPAGSELNVKGWVGAFRLSDGSPVWRFDTIPHRGEPGYETWRNPKNIPMGGGSVWTSFSVDTATGALYVPVTNPAPDFPAQLRPGADLYTNSIVVLDIRTGKLRWYRSLVPNDSHDWDVTHAMPQFTATVNGRLRRLIATAGKDGMLRVLDRDTHAVVYTTAVTTIENATAPVTSTPARVCPGIFGGVEWSGPSYSARTGMLYVAAVDWCATYSSDEEPRYIPGKVYLGGHVALDPPGKAQGWLTAVDAATGAVQWRYRSPRPMVAAVTTTAGDLVFAGELTGDFLALDAHTGAVLYRFNTGGPMGGGIVTYEVSGRQYIAATSGTPSGFWVDENGGAPTIIVFALPQLDHLIRDARHRVSPKTLSRGLAKKVGLILGTPQGTFFVHESSAHYTVSGVSAALERPMTKRKAPEAAAFGQRLGALRRAAALTQQELANEVGVSRRMLAYYEGQSEHPPTTLLPALAQALHVSADELLGLTPPLKRNGRVRDHRMQRRLQQISTLPPEERRQIIQLVDAFIERGRLKRRATQGESA